MSTSPDEPLDDKDADVLDRLAAIFAQRDPAPDGLVERSLFALTLEGLHTEVMRLHRVETAEFALRGEGHGAPGGSRTITFLADSVTVMLSLTPSPYGGVRIDGWSAPATRFVVELYRPDDAVGTESEDDGSFVLADVPPGPASLVLRRSDGSGTAVSTPVIDL